MPRQRTRRPRAAQPAAAVAPPEETYLDLCGTARRQLFDGAAGDAARTARRALELLPHGLEAQRLLGLALLESGEPRQAIAAFQGTLAGDPLDLVAQTAMAEASEQLSSVAAAEGEWRRAWELQPGAPEVEARLQAARQAAGALDAARGAPPLTRVALARIYLRGGLFEHAATEARALLARDPERLDLHLILAEAFWRLGDAESAAAIASSLLERLPDCVMANLLLAAHWQTVGHDVATLMARVQAVDPGGTVAARLFDDREPPPLLTPEAAAPWLAPEPSEAAPVLEAVAASPTVEAEAPAPAAAPAGVGPMTDTQPLPVVAPLVAIPEQAPASAPGEMQPEEAPAAEDLATGALSSPETESPPAPEPPEEVAAAGEEPTPPEPVEAVASAVVTEEVSALPREEVPAVVATPSAADAPELPPSVPGPAAQVPPAPAEPEVREGVGAGEWATVAEARAAGDAAMQARRYLEAMRAYGTALRLLREGGA